MPPKTSREEMAHGAAKTGTLACCLAALIGDPLHALHYATAAQTASRLCTRPPDRSGADFCYESPALQLPA